MEYRYKVITTAWHHIRSRAVIATRAAEYKEKYLVSIKLHDISPFVSKCYAEYGDAIDINDLARMSMPPNTEIEIKVKGKQEKATLRMIAEDIGKVVSEPQEIQQQKFLSPFELY